LRSGDKAANLRPAVAKHDKELGDRLVSKNRRAFFNYEIGDSYEAGLSLSGSEVRALRMHGCDLSDAWVDIDGNEAWVKGMSIPPLQHAAFGHEEKRTRKLLLHREQIERLRGSIEREGMTLIATKCYFKNNRAKLEIALGKGKKKHDKRQSIRAREENREAQAAIRRGR
jgi:SsrA-binding protein